MTTNERLAQKPTPEQINEFVDLMQRRNKSFKTQDPIIPRDPLMAGIVDGLGWWFYKEAKLVGGDNLIQAQEMAKNGPHTLTPNHNSDGDHEGLVRALSINGHADFAKSLGFFAGWKVIDRWYIQKLMGAQTAFVTVAPSDLLTTAIMKNEMRTEEEVKDWKEYRAHIKRVSLRLKSHVTEWEKAGNPTVAYIEGGRLKKPYVYGSPPPEMSKFFATERIITPVNSKGIDRIITTDRIINPFKRGSIQVDIGKPYHTDDLKELLEDRVIKDAKINMVDMALARILLLSPFLPHPKTISPEFDAKMNVLKLRDPYMQKAA